MARQGLCQHRGPPQDHGRPEDRPDGLSTGGQVRCGPIGARADPRISFLTRCCSAAEPTALCSWLLLCAAGESTRLKARSTWRCSLLQCPHFMRCTGGAHSL